MKDSRISKGQLGENLVCQRLEELGFEILGRNIRQKGFSEIDLLARMESKLWLVEVKTHDHPVFDSLIGRAQIKRLKLNQARLQLQAGSLRVDLILAWVKLSEQEVEFFEIR